MNIRSINSYPSISVQNRSSVSKKAVVGSFAANKVQQSDVAFSGLGVFNKLFPKSKTKVLTTAEQVISALADKDFGAYLLTKEGYKFLSPEDFRTITPDMAPEIIIKNAKNLGDLSIQENGKWITKEVSYRTGITPSTLKGFVKNGFSKVTHIADDGVQVLTIPESARQNTKLVKKLAKSPFIPKQQGTIQMMYDAKSGFLYDLSEKMVKEVESTGIKLERTVG